MSPVGFEPTISAGERPHIHLLDCTATGSGVGGINATPVKARVTSLVTMVMNLQVPQKTDNFLTK